MRAIRTRGRTIQAALPLLAIAAAFAAEPTFIPDVTFKGSSIAGWHVLGPAEWQARNGELIGKVKPGGSGGWLVLDRSYQDAGFFASFRCTGDCKTGLLLRAEKTAGGWKGIFLSLDAAELASYRVTLDAQGRELQREKLRPGGGFIRFAPPAVPGRAAPPRRPPPAPAAPLPIQRPATDLRPGEWNQVEALLDANIIRPYLNGGALQGGVADEEFGRYGPLALYVGGSGEVRFKDVAYKDLGVKVTPTERVSPRFRMQRISDMYYSWSAAAGDINRDGILDVVAGPYIYFGPDFTKMREVYPASAVGPSKEFTGVNGQWAVDLTGDGWPDVLVGPSGATLYVNPKGEARRWDKYEVVPAVQSEVALFRDIDRDKVPELVYMAEGFMRYAKPDPADATKPWIVHSVSEKGYGVAHGVGIGDINGDGRLDLLNPYGWWEQPPAGSGQEPWTYHPQAFSRYNRGSMGGAGMFVYDVNGDGLNDVVTSLNAHTFGLAWYEQKRDAAGKISFVEHMISDGFRAKNAGGVTFSEPHGTALADVDGDGVPDFIVGKRYWSHLDTYLDPDPYGPAVLYWYRTVRNPKAPGGAEFVPELIHNRSGAGSDVLAVDLNKDGIVDVVTSTDRGAFIFWGRPRTPAAKTAAAPAGK
jgi:hypothetical protein